MKLLLLLGNTIYHEDKQNLLLSFGIQKFRQVSASLRNHVEN